MAAAETTPAGRAASIPQWMLELADVATGIRARSAAARGLPAPAPVTVQSGPRAARPVQPLPQGFDIETARAELAALEQRGPAPSEFAYSGEAAAEMAAWAAWNHTHQLAGLRFQIAQFEALQGVAA